MICFEGSDEKKTINEKIKAENRSNRQNICFNLPESDMQEWHFSKVSKNFNEKNEKNFNFIAHWNISSMMKTKKLSKGNLI